MDIGFAPVYLHDMDMREFLNRINQNYAAGLLFIRR